MKRQLLISIGLATLCSTSALANGSIRFNLVGLLDYCLVSSSTTSLFGAIEAKGGIGFGGGALLEHRSNGFGIEIGGVFNAQKISTTFLGFPAGTSTIKSIAIPLIARAYFGSRFIYGIGAGGYYSFPMTDGGGQDYGVIGSLRMLMPFGAHHFIFDVQYKRGFKEDGLFGAVMHSIQGFLGISFKF